MNEETGEIGYEKKARAGLIPWISEGGEYRYLFMVASDPKFGGPRPMISKGKIEEGETPIVTALREAEEELGLKQLNLKTELEFLTEERVRLYSGTYEFSVFSVQVFNRWDFDKWCDETEYTVWMTLDEFKVQGRPDHIKYIKMLEEKLRGISFTR